MAVSCHEIFHAGEGEPGPPIKGIHASPYRDAADYAERAANLLDEAEMREAGTRDSDHDGSSRVVEVRGLAGDAGQRRFRVRCRVKREYTAEPEG